MNLMGLVGGGPLLNSQVLLFSLALKFFGLMASSGGPRSVEAAAEAESSSPISVPRLAHL